MSADFFEEHIKPELVKICEKEGWRLSQQNLGHAFERWIAQFFVAYHGLPQGEDIAVEDNILGVKDLGVDILLNDDSQRRCYAVQSKYRGAKATISRNDIGGFFELHSSLMDPGWIQESNASENAKLMLTDYQRQMESHWHAKWIFVTNLKVSDNNKKIAVHSTNRYENDRNGVNVECQVVDVSDLERMYKRLQSRGEPIPEKIEIALEEGYIHSHNPRETLVTVMKGDQLRKWYSEHHDGLFANNVRFFIPEGKMNKEIERTANKTPEDFFYFNNGISAICSSLDVVAGKQATAHDMQIVNGAQTVGALYAANPSDDIRVMLRVVVGDKGASTIPGGFNESVIRCNNSQTAVKDSDFRSNDPIQLHIKKRFEAKGVIPVLGKRVSYRPKRGEGSRPRGKRRNAGKPLSLEELARVRYAYRKTPCVCHENPKDLWDVDKHYREAFGPVDGLWTGRHLTNAS